MAVSVSCPSLKVFTSWTNTTVWQFFSGPVDSCLDEVDGRKESEMVLIQDDLEEVGARAFEVRAV